MKWLPLTVTSVWLRQPRQNSRGAPVRIAPGLMGPRAFFIEAGLQELRELLQDRRAMDPERFAHLRRELGIETGEPGA